MILIDRNEVIDIINDITDIKGLAYINIIERIEALPHTKEPWRQREILVSKESVIQAIDAVTEIRGTAYVELAKRVEDLPYRVVVRNCYGCMGAAYNPRDCESCKEVVFNERTES